MEESRHSAASHEDRLVLPHPGKPPRPDNACKRLDEGALVVGQGLGQKIGTLIHQGFRDEDTFGKTARQPDFYLRALGIMPAFAVWAFHAGDLGRNENPVPRLKFRY